MKNSDAAALGKQIVFELAPHCQKIELAGSIRRGKPDVKDIEIVAMPIIHEQRDLFNTLTGTYSEFDLIDFTRYGRIIKGGQRYKQIELPEGIKLDLFIVLPPAQWGAIMLIRTGPADFSHWIMKERRRGGGMPGHLKQKDGALWQGKRLIETPTEHDYFAALGLDYVEPSQRVARW
jgi:DNA polymerase/3'-5' exonuclease PolX